MHKKCADELKDNNGINGIIQVFDVKIIKYDNTLKANECWIIMDRGFSTFNEIIINNIRSKIFWSPNKSMCIIKKLLETV